MHLFLNISGFSIWLFHAFFFIYFNDFLQDDRRAKVIQRVEEKSQAEREKVMKERSDLLGERRDKQAMIRRLNRKMEDLKRVSIAFWCVYIICFWSNFSKLKENYFEVISWKSLKEVE